MQVQEQLDKKIEADIKLVINAIRDNGIRHNHPYDSRDGVFTVRTSLDTGELSQFVYQNKSGTNTYILDLKDGSLKMDDKVINNQTERTKIIKIFTDAIETGIPRPYSVSTSNTRDNYLKEQANK
jgi:hypothetical protein